jgi:hypothetical protein
MSSEAQEKKKSILNYDTMLGDAIPIPVLEGANAVIQGDCSVVELQNFRGKNCKIFVKFPTLLEESELSRLYAIEYIRLLQSDDNIITTEQLKELYERKGIWNEDKENQIIDLQEQLTRVGIEIGNINIYGDKKLSTSVAKIKHLKKEYQTLRLKLEEIIATKRNLFNISVEGLTEQYILRMKLAICCTFEDGEKIWENISELENEKDKSNLMKIMITAITFWSGLSQDVIPFLSGVGVENRLQRGTPDKEISSKHNVD